MIQYPKAEHMIKQLRKKEAELMKYLESNPDLHSLTIGQYKSRLANVRDLISQLQRKPEDAHLIEHFRFD